MPRTAIHWFTHAAAAAALSATATTAVGCKVLDKLAGGVSAPSADLNRLDLVKSPSINRLLSYSCYEYVDASGTTCALAGWDSKPEKSKMLFSFDIVFDLYNPNSAFAIPLIELLLGLNVFEDENLGAVCVSFCDPAQEDCTPNTNAEGACEVDENTTEVDEASDVIPTVDDLMELADEAVEGNIGDNWDWKVIPRYEENSCSAQACTEDVRDDGTYMCCGGECTLLEPGCSVGKGDNGKTCALCEGHVEAHVQFDFDIDTMLGLAERLLMDAVGDFIAGRNVKVKVPYAADGTLFFDVPKMGRYAFGYGPLEEEWVVQ